MFRMFCLALLLCFSLLSCTFTDVNAAENKDGQFSETTVLNTKIFSNDEFGISLEIPEEVVETKIDSENNEIYSGIIKGDNVYLNIYAVDFKWEFTGKQELVANKLLNERTLNAAKKDKETKNILTAEMDNIGGEDVVHIVALLPITLTQENNSVTFNWIIDQYIIHKKSYFYKIAYLLPETLYEQKYKALLSKCIKTLKFKEVWRTIKIKDTHYSYDLPESLIEFEAKNIAPDHKFISGNRILMTGVIVEKLKDNDKYAYLPDTLDNISKTTKTNIVKNMEQEILKTTNDSAKNIKNSFIKIKGMDCILSEFDDSTSHSLSYIFIKDGNYIAFDYIYDRENENIVRPLIEKSVQSIKL